MSNEIYGTFSGLHKNPANWKAAKLTPAQWDEIRQRRGAGESVRSLALEFGIRANSIYDRFGRQS